MPPLRQEMYFGKILEISKAAETKFATILTPTVATSIVSPKRRTAALLSSLPMTAIGSTINSQKTARVPEIVTTEIKEKKRKLTGSPQKLPFFMSDIVFAYREKSPKLSVGPAK